MPPYAMECASATLDFEGIADTLTMASHHAGSLLTGNLPSAVTALRRKGPGAERQIDDLCVSRSATSSPSWQRLASGSKVTARPPRRTRGGHFWTPRALVGCAGHLDDAADEVVCGRSRGAAGRAFAVVGDELILEAAELPSACNISRGAEPRFDRRAQDLSFICRARAAAPPPWSASRRPQR